MATTPESFEPVTPDDAAGSAALPDAKTSPLPGDPAALMGLGLDSLNTQAQDGMTLKTESPSNAEHRAAPSPSAGFTPPTVEELRGMFTHLEILELLGHGGMGAVYKARQKALDRVVAVKILPPQVGRSPGFAERFTREAKALARLNHANIVHVHDFGKVASPQGGLYYITMEFIDGANLRQSLRTGKIAPAQALAIVTQVCEALQYAHDEGIVHRDIKPENILIDKKGRVKIADFGLAKLAGQSAENFTLTAAGGTMGTPRYMAPEQMDGAHEVDHRADIYSLGVVFYELLTGEVPMGRFDAPSKRVQVDVRLDEVVLRTLERDPDRRYQQVSEVKTQVDEINYAPRQTPAREWSAVAENPLLAGLHFAMTPQPGYANAVGIPILILTGLLVITGILVTVLVPSDNEGIHHLVLIGAPLLLICSFLALHLRWVGTRRDEAGNPNSHPDPHAAQPSASDATLPRKPLMQMGLREAARELFVPEELDRPEVSPQAGWGRIAVIILGVIGTQILLSGMKLSIVVTMMLVVPLLIMMGVIAIKHRGTRRGRQAKFVIVMFVILSIGIPLIMVMPNPQSALDKLYALTGATPGADDAKIIQGMFLIIVFGSLLSLIGYWLKLRKVSWHMAWNRGAALVMLAAIVVAAYLFAADRNKPGTTPSDEFATIQGETGPDTSGLDQGLVRYRVTGPAEHKLVTWVEYYIKGEKRRLREFPQTVWCIPEPGKGISERVELRLKDGDKLSPEGKGKLRWDWNGRGGWMPSPFVGMETVSWSGPQDRRWRLSPGEDAILWAMKGGKGNWSSSLHWGSPATGIMAEAKDADAFLVLKARIEPVTEVERKAGRGGGRLAFEDEAYVPPVAVGPAAESTAKETVTLEGEEHLRFPTLYFKVGETVKPSERVIYYKTPFASPPYLAYEQAKDDGYLVTNERADSFTLQRMTPSRFRVRVEANGEIMVQSGPGGGSTQSTESLKFKWKAEGRKAGLAPNTAALAPTGGARTTDHLAVLYAEVHRKRDVDEALKLFYHEGVTGFEESWLRHQLTEGFVRPARNVKVIINSSDPSLEHLILPPRLSMIGELSIELEDPVPAPPAFTTGFRYLIGHVDKRYYLVAEVLKGTRPALPIKPARPLEPAPPTAVDKDN